ncbi:type II toxin-antitoxin system HicB family antitoxin [Bacillus cereus]|uniref:type II toxin-antitoxin system HicB family antitoxin n=1 Tax=Bacillus cereus TaxID=1396 RepID=UPI000BF4F98A|nr:type II toxin-antitoxin system HicB family antitoxin [Bacillus cereus]MEB9946745.1 type II toxin-antitoxin system HicB family antitoxin [Bacillus cereus]PFF41031.1 pilus assembly protein HicB [Bacillus cereus]PGN92999.1 pilus assembly protein HicB [Bacillus cereus]PGV27933.1 pilus assembly protein HicB [Bacillus cereus]PGX87192.1 pilus assembly protein HicB [Bacillus cereus]
MSTYQDRYIYPSIFDFSNEQVTVTFLDLADCHANGTNYEDAFEMAKKTLATHLYEIEEQKGSIPSASNPASIQTKENQVIGLMEVWMPPFRSEIENKAVKKTLTIPHWLDKMGKANNVNYSQVLQDALKKHLGVTENKNV